MDVPGRLIGIGIDLTPLPARSPQVHLEPTLRATTAVPAKLIVPIQTIMMHHLDVDHHLLQGGTSRSTLDAVMMITPRGHMKGDGRRDMVGATTLEDLLRLGGMTRVGMGGQDHVHHHLPHGREIGIEKEETGRG